jgi:hypothetical protein
MVYGDVDYNVGASTTHTGQRRVSSAVLMYDAPLTRWLDG